MANNNPIFTGRVRSQKNFISANKLNYTVDTADPARYVTIFDASTSDGSYIEKIRIKVQTSTSLATVIKIFTIIPPDTAHCQYDEIYIPATTVSINATSPLYEINMNIPTKSNFYAGSTVANIGGEIQIVTFGGDFTQLT